MGLGSLLLSQELQRSKDFLPEIAPERAASSRLFLPAAVTFRLEVSKRTRFPASVLGAAGGNTGIAY